MSLYDLLIYCLDNIAQPVHPLVMCRRQSVAAVHHYTHLCSMIYENTDLKKNDINCAPVSLSSS